MVKAGEAAALMNTTRQTVNNHIKAGRLIGIREGNDQLVPPFQFIKGGKVEHLEDLLTRLDCAPITKCGFFMAQTETGEARIEVLRRGPSPEELGASMWMPRYCSSRCPETAPNDQPPGWTARLVPLAVVFRTSS